MVKGLLAVTLCFTGLALANDWLEECVEFVNEDNILDLPRCIELLKQCVYKDKQEMKLLKKKLEANDADGIWGTLVGCSDQLKWAQAKSQLAYHCTIGKWLVELPQNKRDHEWFIQELLSIKDNKIQLQQLKEALAQASTLKDRLVLGAQVAAKEVHIQGQKAIIKSRIVL